MGRRASQARPSQSTKGTFPDRTFLLAMERKRILLGLVVVFAAVYYVARIAIFYAGQTGTMEFEEEQSESVESIVLYSFLSIGVVGLVLLPGVYARRPWGMLGTLAVCVYTIVFDTWAAIAVQSSAAAGIVPAAIIGGYLALSRKDFRAGARDDRSNLSRKAGDMGNSVHDGVDREHE